MVKKQLGNKASGPTPKNKHTSHVIILCSKSLIRVIIKLPQITTITTSKQSLTRIYQNVNYILRQAEATGQATGWGRQHRFSSYGKNSLAKGNSIWVENTKVQYFTVVYHLWLTPVHHNNLMLAGPPMLNPWLSSYWLKHWPLIYPSKELKGASLAIQKYFRFDSFPQWINKYNLMCTIC